MMSLYLPSGQVVYDGAVLKIGQDTTTYFLKYGEYTYNSVKCNGWYIQIIGSMTALPVTDSILNKVIVMNNGAEISVSQPTVNGCGCHNTSPVNTQNRYGEKFTSQDKYILDRTWISVNTIAERNSLPISSVMNGRVVQVNQSEDNQVHYYRYNNINMDWTELSFISDAIESIAQIQKLIETNTLKDEELSELVNQLQEKVNEDIESPETYTDEDIDSLFSLLDEDTIIN